MINEVAPSSSFHPILRRGARCIGFARPAGLRSFTKAASPGWRLRWPAPRTVQPTSPVLALTSGEVMIDLAYSYRKTGRTDEAVKLGQSSLDLLRRVSGPTHENTLNAMTELAISYQAAHRTGEPIALEEDSLRLKRQHLPAGHPGTVESIENLAGCYEESGRKPEAEALRRDLAELKTKPAIQNPGAGQSAVAPAKP